MIVVQVLIPLFTFLAIASFLRIRIKKGLINFIYAWAFPIGSFVWEDLFIFSLYGLAASTITLLSNQLKIGYLFFLVFWIVRSAGEALYFFLQQFHRPQHAPHFIEDVHFTLLRRLFGPLNKQQCYIFMQIIFQTILMFSSVGLILLLLNWQSLP